jgi:signal transduction histidine kinase
VDNGIGIPPEHHERIFSLFQRLQNDDHDGTGIGLALAKRAAELLGGSLTVRSTPGSGSTFILTLREAVS